MNQWRRIQRVWKLEEFKDDTNSKGVSPVFIYSTTEEEEIFAKYNWKKKKKTESNNIIHN